MDSTDTSFRDFEVLLSGRNGDYLKEIQNHQSTPPELSHLEVEIRLPPFADVFLASI